MPMDLHVYKFSCFCHHLSNFRSNRPDIAGRYFQHSKSDLSVLEMLLLFFSEV